MDLSDSEEAMGENMRCKAISAFIGTAGELTFGGKVPELDGTVPGASGKVAAVRTPGNGPDDALVRLNLAQQLVQGLPCNPHIKSESRKPSVCVGKAHAEA